MAHALHTWILNEGQGGCVSVTYSTDLDLSQQETIANNRGFMVHAHTITLSGLSKSDAVEFAKRMGFSEGCADQAGEWILRLYDLFIERDATLIEINPMTEDLLGRGSYNVYLNLAVAC